MRLLEILIFRSRLKRYQICHSVIVWRYYYATLYQMLQKLQYSWWFTVYSLYKEEQKFIIFTSNISDGHILRSHVVLICLNLISTSGINFSPVEFGWNSVDSILMSNKCIAALPEMYTVTCGCKKKITGRCHCSKFGTPCRILQVHQRRMLYLSLPIGSVGKIWKY